MVRFREISKSFVSVMNEKVEKKYIKRYNEVLKILFSYDLHDKVKYILQWLLFSGPKTAFDLSHTFKILILLRFFMHSLQALPFSDGIGILLAFVYNLCDPCRLQNAHFFGNYHFSLRGLLFSED